MKEIKKKKSKPDPKILIPVIVGAVCVLMIAVVVIFMNPESTTAGQLQKKLELGDKYLESGDYEKAELAFQEALKIDEKSPDATIKLADTYNKMKKPEKALKMLEQTNENLENMSVAQLNSNPDGWKSKMDMYETVYKQTEQLYQNSGNQMPADIDTSEDVINIFNDIHIYINDYVTPTPKPSEKPGKKEEKKDTTPVPEQEEEPAVTPEETPAPEITEAPEENQEGETTVTPEVSPEATVTPVDPDAEITPEPMTDPAETPIPGGWTVVVAPNQTPTPKPDMNAEPEPQPEPDSELQPEPAPESSQDSSEDTGIPPAVPDYPEDTGIPPAVPDAPEEPAVPPTDQNNAEAPSENQDSQTEQDALTPDQVLDAFAAELLAASPRSSLSTPASYTCGDESGMAAASGTLGAEKRDFNGDGMQELLVISIRNGQLVLDTYTAAGGAASMVSSVAFEECFGKAVEGVTYGGTQTCFIRENGTGFDIGMAGYYFGMNTGDGNPSAKTVAALYTMGADGSLNMSASASLINGTISSPQEGGKDGFISALSSAGMSGSWVSESADMLAGMDLANNPVQDMAGVPNPLGGGLAGKEPGVQDLVVVNAGMQPGSGSMNFSVTDNTTCGK